jgi:RHS repeat-associated protein
LSYDYEDRVTSVTLPSSVTDTFTYNGLDARTGKVDSTGTYSFKRDGADVTDPVLNDSSAEYTPGVSEKRSGTSSFYESDRLGSTTGITNTSQTVTNTRVYDAFGMLLSSSGSNPTPFGFVATGGYQGDLDTGLMLLGHRYYDPSTGRFISRDPTMQGRNWYCYCGNSPQSRMDPSGHWWGGWSFSFIGAYGFSLGEYGVGGGMYSNGGIGLDGYGNIGLYGSTIIGGAGSNGLLVAIGGGFDGGTGNFTDPPWVGVGGAGAWADGFGGGGSITTGLGLDGSPSLGGGVGVKVYYGVGEGAVVGPASGNTIVIGNIKPLLDWAAQGIKEITHGWL